MIKEKCGYLLEMIFLLLSNTDLLYWVLEIVSRFVEKLNVFTSLNIDDIIA